MAFNSNIKGYMTFGKSFSRGAAFPLEAYEIWTDYDALVAYAANTDPNKDPSYIGQKVAYVDFENNKVIHYGIEIDGTLKELGAAPIGDEKTIVIGDNNTISLAGINELTFDRDVIGEDGQPTGTKEEVKYQPLMTKNGLVWIEPSKTTVEGLATLIEDLSTRVKALEDDRVTEAELAAAVKVVADKIGVPAEDDDSTATLYERIAAEIDRAIRAESLLSDRIGAAKNGDTAATGVYAYVDGVIQALTEGVDPDKIDSLNELIAWVEAHPAIVEELDGRLDKIEGILEGIGGENEKATVKAYVDDALIAHEEVADEKYAIATEVEENYAKKATTLAEYGITDAYDKTNTYSKGEVDELINNINEGNQESAGAVSTRLETYITSNDKEIASLKEKDAAHDTAIGENKTLAQKGIDDAAAAKTNADKNTSDITALQGQLGTTNENVSGILTRLGALETEVGVEEKSRIDVLEGIINGAEGTDGLTTIVTGHGTRIGILESADIRIEKKADDNATAILALQNKVDTGEKTVKTYVDDAVKAVADTIDFEPYAKKDEVARTYATVAALENIYKAGSGVEGEEGYVASTGLLVEEIARAKAAEKANADAIALLTNNDSEELDSVIELINHVTEHGKEVEGIINRIDGHDTLLAGIGGDEEPANVLAAIESAKYTLPTATAEKLGGIKSAKDSVDGDITTIATDSVYVDAEGIAIVKAISTDTLVQGKKILVLNGGDASGIN